MTRVRLLFAFVALALILSYQWVDGGTGGYNKAAFEKTMEEANKQARRLLGALVAGDWGMTGSSAKAIEEAAGKIHDLTPKVEVDRIEEFQAHADSLRTRAARLSDAADEKDGAGAAVLLGEIVSTCVTCHETFRK